jgi:hypothetical protein
MHGLDQWLGDVSLIDHDPGVEPDERGVQRHHGWAGPVPAEQQTGAELIHRPGNYCSLVGARQPTALPGDPAAHPYCYERRRFATRQGAQTPGNVGSEAVSGTLQPRGEGCGVLMRLIHDDAPVDQVAEATWEWLRSEVII